LGLAGYDHKFVQNYASISRPLSDLLKKYAPFIWMSQADLAFSTLKAALISTPVLALPDFSAPFVVETDACEHGCYWRTITRLAFVSKSLGPRNRGLSTYKKRIYGYTTGTSTMACVSSA
jgi:hypothetical protein